MLDVISNILDLLSSFFSWVGGLIEDLINVGVQVAKAISSIPSLLVWLPSSISALLIAGFSIVAAYKILGREG